MSIQHYCTLEWYSGPLQRYLGLLYLAVFGSVVAPSRARPRRCFSVADASPRRRALEPGGRRRGERATPVARRATGARDAGRRTRDDDDATTRRG